MKLIDIKSLSEILGVKACTLYQWVELGKIPHYKLNEGKGAVRFSIEEINNWLLSTCKIDPIGYNNTIEGRKPRKGGVK